jgi:hypothetical protein
MARIIRASSSGYPNAATPGAFLAYEADSGLGNLNIGDPVSTWLDNTGHGNTLGVVGPAVAPLFQRDDDQLPYVQFNGTTQGLATAVFASYTGLNLTLFAVARPFLPNPVTGNGNKIFSLGRAGQISGLSNGTVSIDRRGNGEDNYRFGGLGGDDGDGSLQSGIGQNVGCWEVFCIRAGVRGGMSIVSNWRSGMSGWGAQFGLVPTALPARDYQRLSLGWDQPTGGDWLRVDFRAFSLYQALTLSDSDVKDNLRYFAHKWRVPVLD